MALKWAFSALLAMPHTANSRNHLGEQEQWSQPYSIPWGDEAYPVLFSAPPDGPGFGLIGTDGFYAVRTEGDWVHLGSGSGMRSYAMRDPVRPDGERWRVQARHDGGLFLATVHPAHLPCYSGVSWLSLAETGDVVVCGANTAATVFVSPPGEPLGDLLFDLQGLPFTPVRKLVRW